MIIYILFSHPLSLICSVILQTCARFTLIYSIQASIFIRYIIFLIIVGGLLVVFRYLSALIPNETFRQTSLLLIVLVFRVRLITSIKTLPHFNNITNHLENFSILQRNKLIIITLSYIILILCLVIRLSSYIKSPLKRNTYDFTKNAPYYKNLEFVSIRSSCAQQHYPLLKPGINTGNLSYHPNYFRHFLSHTL